MQRLEVSGAVRPLYGSLGVKGLNTAQKFARSLTFKRIVTGPTEICVRLGWKFMPVAT